MGRISIGLPEDFMFSTALEVRITDINYGNHMSNDVYLALMHEARMRFFQSFGYSEMDLAGVGVIMSDTAIVFKKECFYGDLLTIDVTASEFTPKGFDIYYRFTKSSGELACEAKTGMVCFDYKERKTVNVPAGFRSLFVG